MNQASYTKALDCAKRNADGWVSLDLLRRKAKQFKALFGEEPKITVNGFWIDEIGRPVHLDSTWARVMAIDGDTVLVMLDFKPVHLRPDFYSRSEFHLYLR